MGLILFLALEPEIAFVFLKCLFTRNPFTLKTSPFIEILSIAAFTPTRQSVLPGLRTIIYQLNF